jgi:hypothetical protein
MSTGKHAETTADNPVDMLGPKPFDLNHYAKSQRTPDANWG